MARKTCVSGPFGHLLKPSRIRPVIGAWLRLDFGLAVHFLQFLRVAVQVEHVGHHVEGGGLLLYQLEVFVQRIQHLHHLWALRLDGARLTNSFGTKFRLSRTDINFLRREMMYLTDG